MFVRFYEKLEYKQLSSEYRDSFRGDRCPRLNIGEKGPRDITKKGLIPYKKIKLSPIEEKGLKEF